MAKKEKLLHRFLEKPKDFRWNELVTLLCSLGYEHVKAGKTGGSRVRFIHSEYPPILLHKPHPEPFLKPYQIQDIISLLREEGVL